MCKKIKRVYPPVFPDHCVLLPVQLPARLIEFLMGMILGWGVRYVKLYAEKVKLGDISFPCYLIHNILIVHCVINNPAPQTEAGKAVLFCSVLALTVMIAPFLERKPNKQ